MALRQWLDPDMLYDHTVPAGRLLYLWGGSIYPAMVISVTAITILVLTTVVEMALNGGAGAPIADRLAVVLVVLVLFLYLRVRKSISSRGMVY